MPPALSTKWQESETNDGDLAPRTRFEPGDPYFWLEQPAFSYGDHYLSPESAKTRPARRIKVIVF